MMAIPARMVNRNSALYPVLGDAGRVLYARPIVPGMQK